MRITVNEANFNLVAKTNLSLNIYVIKYSKRHTCLIWVDYRAVRRLSIVKGVNMMTIITILIKIIIIVVIIVMNSL